MEYNSIDSTQKSVIRKLNLIRLAAVAIIAAVTFAIYSIPSVSVAYCIIWLIFGVMIFNFVITSKYKELLVSKITNGLSTTHGQYGNIQKYNIVEGDACYSFEDAYSLGQGEKKVVFSELKIKSSNRYRFTLFSGNTYCCRLSFDTGNTVFLYSKNWLRRIKGNNINLECDAPLNCLTIDGMLNGEIRQMISSKIVPALMRLSLGDFAAILDGDRLTIVEKDSADYFDITCVSNIKKKASRDSQMLCRMKGNLEVLSELVQNMSPLETAPATAWIPKRHAPLVSLTADTESSKPESVCPETPAAEPVKEVAQAVAKTENAMPSNLIFLLGKILGFLLAGLAICFGGGKLGIAIGTVLIVLSIMLPKYILNKIFLRHVAEAVFGSKATTEVTSKSATISYGNAEITSTSYGGSVATTILVKDVIDEAPITARLHTSMQGISRYSTYNISPCSNGVKISLSNVGMRLSNSLEVDSNDIWLNVRDLITIKEIIG